MKKLLFLLNIYVCAVLSSCSNHDVIDYEKYRIKNIDDSQINYSLSQNYGKSIAVFGGSHSALPEADICKRYWTEALNLTVHNYGINGSGYSNKVKPHCIQNQIMQAINSGNHYDIFLLWSPTNDFSKVGDNIGSPSDYTINDGFDTCKLSTMYGGLNFCLKNIREKRPDTKIMLFTSLPIFNKGESGYNPFYNQGIGLIHYVNAEKEWCTQNGIPCLDLFNGSGFNKFNKVLYYTSDNLHINESGYEHIKPITTIFLSEIKNE